jgi:UDP-N-acetylmuramoyl-L-alanyl-D-glutamate--2,6-diaminopimelate ligase
MTLNQLLKSIRYLKLTGSAETEINSIQYDSRKVEPGAIFVALKGIEADGHHFIDAAIENGASVIVAEVDAPNGCEVTWITCRDTRSTMSRLAAAFHNFPSQKASLKVAGVTGTNGKTTTAFILYHLLTATLRRCGMLGTVRYEIAGEVIEATHTTPESLDLQCLLAQMVEADCRGVVMEVSSHGLQQKRTEDVEFDVGIFTNLTRDHLDYHKTMQAYYEAKKILFDQIQRQERKGKIVINKDDEYGRRLLQQFSEAISYGVSVGCDFKASDLRSGFDGSTFQLEAKGRNFLVRMPLIGRFNMYNALGALAACSAIGLNFREAVQNLATLPQVPGRLESVGTQTSFKVFVDYAHTPDALANALRTVRELSPKRIVTVFGCGGNRDIPKRAQMGAIAAELSDRTIITSDNPRKESPLEIIRGIEQGFRARPDSYAVVEDRRKAISEAIALAEAGDIILIAGKGHETTQTFADRTIEFDDRVIAKIELEKRQGSVLRE